MKYIISISGGKDSTACLLYMLERVPRKDIIPVFCDTKWEHQYTYDYLEYLERRLNISIIRLESEGMEALVKRMRCLPNHFRRFCTKELKTKPFHKWLKEFKKEFVIIEGIRREESRIRSNTESFEVKESYFHKRFFIPTLYPIAYWSKDTVINYIKNKQIKLNPLYAKGYSRVGCFPCVFWGKQDLRLFANEEKYLKRMRNLEEEVSKLIGKKVKFFEDARDKFLRTKSLFEEAE